LFPQETTLIADQTCECGGWEAHRHEHPAAARPITRTLSLAGALATTLALTACSQSSSGTPTPQDTTEATTTTSAKANTSNTASASPIADIDPCTLLTPDERTQLGGLGEGERKDLLGAPGCSWLASGKHRIGIDLNDKLGINDLKDPGGTSIDLTVNGRKARKIPGNKQAGTTGMCEFGLEIGPSSRALIIVTTVTGPTEEACQIADQAAQVFEPKLPKS